MSAEGYRETEDALTAVSRGVRFQEGSKEPPAKGNAECQTSFADEELTFGEECGGASDYAWFNTSLRHMACKLTPWLLSSSGDVAAKNVSRTWQSDKLCLC